MNKIKDFLIHPRIRLIFWLTLFLLILFSITPRGYAQALPSDEPSTFPYTKKFVISSYYTPLPNQTHYVTGIFEGDVYINGDFITADGTRVYPGLIAAPKRFAFGTKMKIPGFGIATVHDRGGAIKGDRLDIWVGEGDIGLRRALAWGLKTIDVTVYGVDATVQESVNLEVLPLAENIGILARTKYFRVDLGPGDTGEDVKNLQLFLKKLGYFVVEVTGTYGDETLKAVEAFQIWQKVIESIHDEGAGNFGPRTRVALEAALETQKIKTLEKLPRVNIEQGSTQEEVKMLQVLLAQYGFLKEVNGTFDQAMVDAIIRLQTDAGIIQTANDFGAGTYGPRTQEALEKLVAAEFTPSVSAPQEKNEENIESLPAVVTKPDVISAVTASATIIEAPLIEPSKDVFTIQLKLHDKGPDVVALQEELTRLHFFALTPTGNFGKTTEHAVFKFQQAVGIVKDEKTPGAGIVGPQTMEKLNAVIAAREGQKKVIAHKTNEREIVMQRLHSEKVLLASAALSDVTEVKNEPASPRFAAQIFSNNLVYGNRGEDVEKLQQILKKLSFFPGRLTTEYFGDITKNALRAFQKSHGLEESGDFDERTRRIMNQLVSAV